MQTSEVGLYPYLTLEVALRKYYSIEWPAATYVELLERSHQQQQGHRHSFYLTFESHNVAMLHCTYAVAECVTRREYQLLVAWIGNPHPKVIAPVGIVGAAVVADVVVVVVDKVVDAVVAVVGSDTVVVAAAMMMKKKVGNIQRGLDRDH